MRLLIVWLINAAALFALPYLMSSINVDSFMVALIAALVLGLINTFIRPLLVLLTLPATLLSLGLFIFVINGLLFWFVGSYVSRVSRRGFLVRRGRRDSLQHHLLGAVGDPASRQERCETRTLAAMPADAERIFSFEFFPRPRPRAPPKLAATRARIGGTRTEVLFRDVRRRRFHP